MSTTSTAPRHETDHAGEVPRRRPSSETKNAFSTTEPTAYDPFGTTTAVHLAGHLTIAYLVSRGPGTSGRHENHSA